MSESAAVIPLSSPGASDLESYFMPFTSNRAFKKNPRLFTAAKGMYYTTPDGRQVLDGLSGLWCCNAGHCHPKIVAAVQQQVATMDYAPAFQMGHPQQFEIASRLAELTPRGLDRVFFASSGSEAVDTALKIALAYHRLNGEAQRTRLIGREKGYHGVGFGGISVGGVTATRKLFATAMLPGVDHLPHTHNLAEMAYSRGQPEWGGHLANDLERVLALHDPSTVAAVIVEPVQGSAGVVVPPQGYLQRLREICDQHGILLIFDEVITGFGRLGASFGAQRFAVTPDLIIMAKGMTSGVVPMGGVAMRNDIHDAFMQGPEYAIEFAHGYTYSGHPLAAAAGLATLDVYQEEGLFERARSLEPAMEDAVHSLRGLPNVVDCRNIGLVGAVELQPIDGEPTVRAYRVFQHCYDNGVFVRYTGETIAVAPPLIISEAEIQRIFDAINTAIAAVG